MQCTTARLGRTTVASARRPAFVLSLLCAAVRRVPACARAQAKTIAELPPLDMPAPPPRVVEADRAEAAAAGAAAGRAGAQPAGRGRAAPRRPRRAPRPPGRSRRSRNRRRSRAARAAEEPPTAADDAADDADAAAKAKSSARSARIAARARRPISTGSTTGAERRRADAVRHGEAIRQPGGGCAARQEPGLRQQSGRQGGDALADTARGRCAVANSARQARRHPAMQFWPAPVRRTDMHSCQHLATDLKEKHNMWCLHA